MNAVDKYVIYDDVNYIKGGWINRNRISSPNGPVYINVSLKGKSPNKLINEISLNENRSLMAKCLQKIESTYRKAPFFLNAFPLVEKIFNCDETNIVNFLVHSFFIICNYLDIKTDFILSSELKKDTSLKGQAKILSICKLLDADEYYNAIGGQALYNGQIFEENGIKLRFLKTKDIKYKQFENDFQNDLSIIDVMMFNSPEEIHKMLSEYTILEGN